MISAKVSSKIPLEHGKSTKYRIRLVSGDCYPNSEEYTKFKFYLLKQIAEDPTLTLCNTTGFQKLNMEHNGKNWEIVCEAIVKEPEQTSLTPSIK